MGIGRIASTKLRSVEEEEKTIPSCLDAPPVLPQSILGPKNTDWPKLDRFMLLILDILNAQRVSAALQLESQS
jgi:hypothetical protein